MCTFMLLVWHAACASYIDTNVDTDIDINIHLGINMNLGIDIGIEINIGVDRYILYRERERKRKRKREREEDRQICLCVCGWVCVCAHVYIHVCIQFHLVSSWFHSFRSALPDHPSGPPFRTTLPDGRHIACASGFSSLVPRM